MIRVAFAWPLYGGIEPAPRLSFAAERRPGSSSEIEITERLTGGVADNKATDQATDQEHFVKAERKPKPTA